MNRFNRMASPIGLTLLVWWMGVHFRPLLPIDETRYLTVAWEMYSEHSLLVPLLNGMPYAHKPPLLFWLILLLWKIFQVNALLPRMIPLIFSICNLILIDEIVARLWPNRHKKISSLATLMLSTSLIWAFFSSAVMFDMVLTFWVLMGILGLIMMVKGSPKAWIIIGVSIGGGLLTKGPVIFVHLLPLMLLYPFWGSEHLTLEKYAFRSIGLALGLGGVIALVWAIPAAVAGGKEFALAIFWGQTAGRMVSSFDHGRPIWWYFPMVLLLIFPWGFWKMSWLGLFSRKKYPEKKPMKNRLTENTDAGTRLCLIWLFSAFLLFSLISGKQMHYLLPEIPALMLLISKGIVTDKSDHGTLTRWDHLIPFLYMTLGGIFFLLPRFPLGADLGNMELKTVLPIGAAIFSLGGGMALCRFKTLRQRVGTIAISSVIFMGVIYLFGDGVWKRYDLTEISLKINKLQEQGTPILSLGRYQGEFHFIGRLTRPITPIDSIPRANTLPHSAVIVRTKAHTLFPGYTILHEQPYRNGRLLLLQSENH